jgi:hypothetical protein
MEAIEEAEKAGFDLSLVDESLALSHEERARQHDQALALVLEFDRIRNERDAKPQPPSATLAESGVDFVFTGGMPKRSPSVARPAA